MIDMNNDEAEINDEANDNCEIADDIKPAFGQAQQYLGSLAQGVNKPSTKAQNCNFDSHIVLMKGITWARDSHGLFDYESRHLVKKTLKAEKPCMIMRLENELSLSAYSDKESFQE